MAPGEATADLQTHAQRPRREANTRINPNEPGKNLDAVTRRLSEASVAFGEFVQRIKKIPEFVRLLPNRDVKESTLKGRTINNLRIDSVQDYRNLLTRWYEKLTNKVQKQVAAREAIATAVGVIDYETGEMRGDLETYAQKKAAELRPITQKWERGEAVTYQDFEQVVTQTQEVKAQLDQAEELFIRWTGTNELNFSDRSFSTARARLNWFRDTFGISDKMLPELWEQLHDEEQRWMNEPDLERRQAMRADFYSHWVLKLGKNQHVPTDAQKNVIVGIKKILEANDIDTRNFFRQDQVQRITHDPIQGEIREAVGSVGMFGSAVRDLQGVQLQIALDFVRSEAAYGHLRYGVKGVTGENWHYRDIAALRYIVDTNDRRLPDETGDTSNPFRSVDGATDVLNYLLSLAPSTLQRDLWMKVRCEAKLSEMYHHRMKGGKKLFERVVNGQMDSAELAEVFNEGDERAIFMYMGEEFRAAFDMYTTGDRTQIDNLLAGARGNPRRLREIRWAMTKADQMREILFIDPPRANEDYISFWLLNPINVVVEGTALQERVAYFTEIYNNGKLAIVDNTTLPEERILPSGEVIPAGFVMRVFTEASENPDKRFDNGRLIQFINPITGLAMKSVWQQNGPMYAEMEQIVGQDYTFYSPDGVEVLSAGTNWAKSGRLAERNLGYYLKREGQRRLGRRLYVERIGDNSPTADTQVWVDFLYGRKRGLAENRFWASPLVVNGQEVQFDSANPQHLATVMHQLGIIGDYQTEFQNQTGRTFNPDSEADNRALYATVVRPNLLGNGKLLDPGKWDLWFKTYDPNSKSKANEAQMNFGGDIQEIFIRGLWSWESGSAVRKFCVGLREPVRFSKTSVARYGTFSRSIHDLDTLIRGEFDHLRTNVVNWVGEDEAIARAIHARAYEFLNEARVRALEEAIVSGLPVSKTEFAHMIASAEQKGDDLWRDVMLTVEELENIPPQIRTREQKARWLDYLARQKRGEKIIEAARIVDLGMWAEMAFGFHTWTSESYKKIDDARKEKWLDEAMSGFDGPMQEFLIYVGWNDELVQIYDLARRERDRLRDYYALQEYGTSGYVGYADLPPELRFQFDRKHSDLNLVLTDQQIFDFIDTREMHLELGGLGGSSWENMTYVDPQGEVHQYVTRLGLWRTMDLINEIIMRYQMRRERMVLGKETVDQLRNAGFARGAKYNPEIRALFNAVGGTFEFLDGRGELHGFKTRFSFLWEKYADVDLKERVKANVDEVPTSEQIEEFHRTLQAQGVPVEVYNLDDFAQELVTTSWRLTAEAVYVERMKAFIEIELSEGADEAQIMKSIHGDFKSDKIGPTALIELRDYVREIKKGVLRDLWEIGGGIKELGVGTALAIPDALHFTSSGNRRRLYGSVKVKNALSRLTYHRLLRSIVTGKVILPFPIVGPVLGELSVGRAKNTLIAIALIGPPFVGLGGVGFAAGAIFSLELHSLYGWAKTRVETFTRQTDEDLKRLEEGKLMVIDHLFSNVKGRTIQSMMESLQTEAEEITTYANLGFHK